MRIKYYLISFLLGILYIIGYLIILNIYNWNYMALSVIDLIFLITSLGFLIMLIIKDIVDEIQIRHSGHAVGGPQIEHAPFIFTLAVTVFLSIFIYSASYILKIILCISCLLEGVYDIYQDYRTKSLR